MSHGIPRLLPGGESAPGAAQAAPHQGACWFMPALSWDRSTHPCSATLQAVVPMLCKTQRASPGRWTSFQKCGSCSREKNIFSCLLVRQNREGKTGSAVGTHDLLVQGSGQGSSSAPSCQRHSRYWGVTASLFNNSSEKAKQRQVMGAAQRWEYVSSLWSAELQRGPRSAASAAGKSSLENFGTLCFQ